MIPLDGFSGDVSLRLQSAMTKIGNYSMSAQLVMAQSIAEDAPVNGTVVASLDELQFFISDTALAMKVTEANACHLFEVGDTMNINIQLQPTSLPTGYKLIAAQEQKKDTDANYSFYGVYYDTTKTDSGYALAVPAPTSPGNYRIRFYIESQYGTNVLETVYYFIVD